MYWLLLAAAYGLVNAGAKWQEHCDQFFGSLGLKQSTFVPQLFFFKSQGSLTLIAVKIVDDVLISDPHNQIDHFIAQFKGSYNLGRRVSVQRIACDTKFGLYHS